MKGTSVLTSPPPKHREYGRRGGRKIAEPKNRRSAVKCCLLDEIGYCNYKLRGTEIPYNTPRKTIILHR